MRSFFSLFCALCSGVFVAADFTKPDSSQGDFYQSWRVGDTVDISWNAGWNWGKGAQPDVADLFVMWFDHPTQFSQLVLGTFSHFLLSSCPIIQCVFANVEGTNSQRESVHKRKTHLENRCAKRQGRAGAKVRTSIQPAYSTRGV